MTIYGTIPFQSVQFDEQGNLKSAKPTPPEVTDLLVFSHGWNNDHAEATDLYEELLTNVSEALAKIPSGGGRTFAAIGIYWPSKKFDFDGRGEVPDAQATPVNGIGSLALNGPTIKPDVDKAMQQLAKLYKDNDPLVDKVRNAVANRKGSDGTELIVALRALVPPTEKSSLDASDLFYKDKPALIFRAAQDAKLAPQAGGAITSAGQMNAQGLGGIVDSIENGFAHLLNLGTYYTMKARASAVGEKGLAPLLDEWGNAAGPKRIHLGGHSFGARLVTAAAMTSKTERLASMSLLQAAFSQNGFATGGIEGYFRKVATGKRIAGPVVITYSDNDKAVGKAYALASRLSGVDSEAFGGPNDRFGGLGANGAQGMLQGEFSLTDMVPAGTHLTMRSSVFTNLQSTRFISSHHDVRNVNVAWAVANAIAAAP